MLLCIYIYIIMYTSNSFIKYEITVVRPFDVGAAGADAATGMTGTGSNIVVTRAAARSWISCDVSGGSGGGWHTRESRGGGEPYSSLPSPPPTICGSPAQLRNGVWSSNIIFTVAVQEAGPRSIIVVRTGAEATVQCFVRGGGGGHEIWRELHWYMYILYTRYTRARARVCIPCTCVGVCRSYWCQGKAVYRGRKGWDGVGTALM